MQSLEKSIDRPVTRRPDGAGHSEHRLPWARMAMVGLTVWVSGLAAGCGGGGGGGGMSQEQQEKQKVVQEKMKDFMKRSKIPTRPGR